MINLKELTTKYPECLESGDKLRSYLKDLYPNEKARINILVSIFACGIAENIKNKKSLGEIEKASYCSRLENEFGYAEKLSKECLTLWAEVYNAQFTADKEKAYGNQSADSNIITDNAQKEQTKLTHNDTKPKTDDTISSTLLAEFEIESNKIIKFIGKTTNVVIPNSVTSIGRYAFKGCSSLQSISIQNSVTSIGEYAFSDCNSLQSISIPNSVTTIENYTFLDCESLQSISIPNSVKSIGHGAFRGCERLQRVTIPNSVTSIGWYVFKGCSSLQSISIPNSVKSIGEYAFDECKKVTLYCKSGSYAMNYAIANKIKYTIIDD